MNRDDKIVDFPKAAPEEQARRLQIEVERLARQSPKEWMFWLDGVAEKHGVERADLKAMIEATIKANEKKAREDKAEDRQREKRAEKQRSTAKREQERKQKEADKEAERQQREREKALAAIIKLPRSEHEAKLKELAKKLGEDIELLRDALVVLDDEKIETGEIEPWDEPVNTRALLNELEAQFRRYIVVHDEAAATVITLWICFAWCHEIATFSPILVVQGADTEMAKTTACKVTSLLTPRAHVIVEPTGATLYRFVDRHHPTLIIDDADRLLPRRPDLAHIVNSSWTRGILIPRWDVSGNTHLYDPFCPKVLSGIDLLAHLAPATRTRCITTQLLPKLAHEQVTSFRRAARDENFLVLRRKLMRWATDSMAAIENANPIMPEGFISRLEENYQLLFAIADLAGGDWPKKARAAAVKLSRERNEPSLGKRLLATFYDLFVKHGTLLTSKQVEQLLTADESDWASYRGRGPINKFEIAQLLRPYGIGPKIIHPRGRAADRGYDATWPEFEIAFKHYLGKTLAKGRTVVRKRPRKSRK
jgi:putative DNA primase/helicase